MKKKNVENPIERSRGRRARVLNNQITRNTVRERLLFTKASTNFLVRAQSLHAVQHRWVSNKRGRRVLVKERESEHWQHHLARARVPVSMTTPPLPPVPPPPASAGKGVGRRLFLFGNGKHFKRMDGGEKEEESAARETFLNRFLLRVGHHSNGHGQGREDEEGGSWKTFISALSVGHSSQVDFLKRFAISIGIFFLFMENARRIP